MSRILIADCWPGAMQAPLAGLGLRCNIGWFEDALRRHEPDIDCVSIAIADGEALPAGTTIGDFDGVILTGSPLHIGDPSPAVRQQIDWARAVFATDVPVWGSCWGLQLAAAALGGTVRRNPNGREIGVARAIATTEAGRGHPLLTGRPAVFDALCIHLDEVATLPPGGAVLAQNAVSAVQALAAPTPGGGWFFGTQYHPELDLAVLAALLRLLATPLTAEGFGRDEADLRAVADDYDALAATPERRDLAWRYGVSEEIRDPLRRTAEFGNWLRAAVYPRRRW